MLRAGLVYGVGSRRGCMRSGHSGPEAFRPPSPLLKGGARQPRQRLMLVDWGGPTARASDGHFHLCPLFSCLCFGLTLSLLHQFVV